MYICGLTTSLPNNPTIHGTVQNNMGAVLTISPDEENSFQLGQGDDLVVYRRRGERITRPYADILILQHRILADLM